MMHADPETSAWMPCQSVNYTTIDWGQQRRRLENEIRNKILLAMTATDQVSLAKKYCSILNLMPDWNISDGLTAGWSEDALNWLPSDARPEAVYNSKNTSRKAGLLQVPGSAGVLESSSRENPDNRNKRKLNRGFPGIQNLSSSSPAATEFSRLAATGDCVRIEESTVGTLSPHRLTDSLVKTEEALTPQKFDENTHIEYNDSDDTSRRGMVYGIPCRIGICSSVLFLIWKV
ncbi:hypothetical protein C922_00006 [Plasmodium inui San Antonio 1]|uniref:Uncharacterized protein n=1 Tax=Plasmodium inui San Antonio 1 TaxID=1237626 RepID=W7ACW0_9APIC|nr:hypothetical protein C922_00006 [Plasmodium inui San Antonio 1]EUD69143.1 hypothetical protein C922_00006 [Plasmodium inui San Antonio 1]